MDGEIVNFLCQFLFFVREEHININIQLYHINTANTSWNCQNHTDFRALCDIGKFLLLFCDIFFNIRVLFSSDFTFHWNNNSFDIPLHYIVVIQTEYQSSQAQSDTLMCFFFAKIWQRYLNYTSNLLVRLEM